MKTISDVILKRIEIAFSWNFLLICESEFRYSKLQSKTCEIILFIFNFNRFHEICMQREREREEIVVFHHHILRTSGNCRNTPLLTHFTQKFRENDGFTKEITK